MTSYTRGHNAARVAVLFLLAAVVFGAFFLFVTDRGLGMSRPTVFVRMSSAGGLAKRDPVFYRGVNVGAVNKLIFSQEGDVVIEAKLERRLPLTSDAHAELVALDLFGRQSLVLRDGTRGAPPLEQRDTIPGITPASMANRVSELGAKADRLLGDTMITLLRESLAGTAEATHQMALLGSRLQKLIAKQEASVTQMTNAAAAVAENIRVVTEPEELIQTRGNLQRATARLDTTTQTLATMFANLSAGEGNAGKFMKDEELYERTNALIMSLDELVRDVKANPKRYINVKVF
jgi:phospholipid/cholesterol/gamma-HCH transport system substrate-binding protein